MTCANAYRMTFEISTMEVKLMEDTSATVLTDADAIKMSTPPKVEAPKKAPAPKKPKPVKAKKAAPAKKAAGKPKAKSKPVKKPPARQPERTARLELRVTSAERKKVLEKAAKTRRTVTSIISELLEKL